MSHVGPGESNPDVSSILRPSTKGRWRAMHHIRAIPLAAKLNEFLHLEGKNLDFRHTLVRVEPENGGSVLHTTSELALWVRRRMSGIISAELESNFGHGESNPDLPHLFLALGIRVEDSRQRANVIIGPRWGEKRDTTSDLFFVVLSLCPISGGGYTYRTAFGRRMLIGFEIRSRTLFIYIRAVCKGGQVGGNANKTQISSHNHDGQGDEAALPRAVTLAVSDRLRYERGNIWFPLPGNVKMASRNPGGRPGAGALV
ncbi:hypothetical protein K438DRAFT_1756691 [Mycena galopus ATCC 62051]|nr:hypothetical protein K438DRAFT_1756691 [Mycena galopus ATCC 62051]